MKIKDRLMIGLMTVMSSVIIAQFAALESGRQRPEQPTERRAHFTAEIVVDNEALLAYKAKKLLALPQAQAQEKPKAEEEPKYFTGWKLPDNYEETRARTVKQSGYITFPKVTARDWDCRTLSLVGPIKAQGGCGSCWDFAAIVAIEGAFYKANYGKPDGSFTISEQYILDCEGSNGGCNGDDHSTVLNHAMKVGIPTTQEYGPYKASRQRCHVGQAKLLKIAGWGYVEPGVRGVMSTQKIKDAIVQYGPVSTTICADNALMAYKSGVFKGNGRQLNHQVGIIGWDDSKGSGGCWIMRNSWGTGWGEAGYCFIEYGANLIGTETVWATATALPPSPEAPKITSALEARGFPGQAFSYQIAASGNPSSYGATGLPAGLTVNATSGLVSGTHAATTISKVTVSATNVAGVGTAVVTFAIGAIPEPDPQPQPGGAPTITSAATATAQANANFTYQIAATNTPTAYGATGMPAGLKVDTSTGVISGSVAATGSYSIGLLAINGAGVGQATLTLTVGTGPAPMPGVVSINLTADQVNSVLAQTDPEVLIAELQKRLQGQKGGRPQAIDPRPIEERTDRISSVEAEVKALKRGTVLILDRLDAMKAGKP